jgi:TolB-like protein
MKKFWNVIFFFFLFSIQTLWAGERKITVLVLDFINASESNSSFQSDFLGQKIAEEFRFVLSKSKNIEIFSADPLYKQLRIFQKPNFGSNQGKILKFLERYEQRMQVSPVAFILSGEYRQKGDQIFLKMELRSRNEGTLVLVENVDRDFPQLNGAELWQLNACSKAVFLAEKQFEIRIYDGYIEACGKPHDSGTVLESSKRVWVKLQEDEKILARLDQTGQSKICPQKCLAESDEEKILHCFQTCQLTTSTQRKNLELSKIYLGGYEGLALVPSEEKAIHKFRDNYLETLIETLKNLPSNTQLVIQGRISKKYSDEKDIFEISKKKAEKAKEIIQKEILGVSKENETLVKKIKIEACGDICFQEFPPQIDSSYKDNDVTFRIRMLETGKQKKVTK